MFRQDCTCPALLEDLKSCLPVRGSHPVSPPFPERSGSQPQATGLVRFRSPLLAESRLMSFPPVTEMFQFTGFASRHYGFMSGYPCGWVAPFGDRRINVRSQLPGAFRSVPRPSSPRGTKASTKCPYCACSNLSVTHARTTRQNLRTSRSPAICRARSFKLSLKTICL